MANAPDQMPPPQENRISALHMHHPEVVRIKNLPPIEYQLMNSDQRAAFLRWYIRTPEGAELLCRYRNDTQKGIMAFRSTGELSDDMLKESILESFKLYVQQKWSCDGKQPPQPDSYFLFQKKYAKSSWASIYLTIKMDLVVPLVFSHQEIEQMKASTIETVATAIGSERLHFHEIGRLTYRQGEKVWVINLYQNGKYFSGASSEFVKEETIDVWFRRAKNGMPQFILCPAVSKKLPLLALPLTTPGQPEAVLALSRLEAMPALLPEMFRQEKKNDFYNWLLANDKLHIEDKDPEIMKLAPLLFHFCSNDFHLADPRILNDKVARLYEEYVLERWNMPSKHPPVPQSFYLFENIYYSEHYPWISFIQELMQQTKSLVLNTQELDQLQKSNSLPVMVCIFSTNRIDTQGLLENIKNVWKICFSDNEEYKFIFRELRTRVCAECWFMRSQNKPVFIIKPT